MRYCLHHSGIINNPGHPLWDTVSGADKKLYIFRLLHLKNFLEAAFGKPDKTVLNPRIHDFSGMKGILVFTRQWGNAAGHATLWNGQKCADHCYFEEPSKAKIWLLK